MSRPLPSLLIASLLLGSPFALAKPQVAIEKDGSVRMENNLLTLQWATRTGSGLGEGCGIVGLRFKPADAEMVNVLYGQTDYLTGRLFGEVWDPVEFNGFQEARIDTGRLYTPQAYGVASDDSAAFLTQVSEGDYRMERTATLRRDLATVEVRYTLTNLKATTPGGFALRLHNVASPSARGIQENRAETIQLSTSEGVIALDQSLSLTEYAEKYKGQKFFLPIWEQEPKRWWVAGKQPTAPLNALWAAEYGGKEGDGLFFTFEEASFVGYYNSPGSTIEPVLRAQVLRPGESWSFTGYVAPFSGLKEGTLIANGNALYLETEPLQLEDGTLKGVILPFFHGKLKILDADGNPLSEHVAQATKPLAITASGVKAPWQLAAFDTKGKPIGHVNSDGTFALAPVEIPNAIPAPPIVKGKVHLPENATSAIAAFLEPRDFIIYCDWNAPAAVKEAAHALSHKLGVGVTTTQPRDEKTLYIGTPLESETIRDIGKLKQTLSTHWPGKGKGAILPYENIELTRAPGLLIGGSDEVGVLEALQTFETQWLKDVKAPSGFTLRAVGIEEPVFPYTAIGVKPALEQVIRASAARGEYEPAQFVLKAFDSLRDIKTTLAPLVHAETGEELKGKHLTAYRRDRGPLWLRWVEYYPLDLPNGETGYPDPLLEKSPVDLPAATTRAGWLTFIVPEDAAPGLYKSTLTVEANGQTHTLPIELTVWDFNLPDIGVKGEPYMSYDSIPPDNKRWLLPQHVREMTQNMVEHGMRVLHVGAHNDGLFRWHFSPEGAYKGKETDWLIVSEDGQVALDVSGFNERIALIDEAAKPFQMEYLLMYQPFLNWPFGIGKFRQTLPDRFSHLPEREGHPYSSHYAQEMLSLLKRHLEKKGWLDRMTMKISDEPPGFGFWWDRFTLAAREAEFPFMTCLNSVDWREAEVAFNSPMRIVQPLYLHYDKEYFDKARKAGIKISWYNCGPPPKNSVQTPASHLRAYLWQAAKADLDLVSWWGIQNWNHHSHHDLWHHRHSHWDSLIYPQHPKIAPWRLDGKGRQRDASPIDSRRWEQIRDGLEDTAYVNLLRQRIEAARERGDTAKADRGQAVLDGIWQDTFPTLNDYQPPFSAISESRQKVAEAILDLAPPATQAANP